MSLALLLAHGVPGLAQESPSEAWVDDRIRERLRLDEQIEIMTDSNEFPDPAPRPAPRGLKKQRKPQPFVRDYRAIARAEARRAGISRPGLFVRQMAAESGFQPCARSHAGALGIAQIMPATARSWKVDPHIPESALRVAAQNMARYERQYGSFQLALAAYNAGPGAVNRYGGVPPYQETREYIRRIYDQSYPLPGMTQVFRLPAGMDPEFQRRLLQLQRAVRRNGGRIWVTEGHRSYEEQLRIWVYTKRKHGGFEAARRWAAPPGCSNHGRGYAADLGGDVALARRLASRFGLVFPMPHEPWHVELAGIPTQSG